MPTLHLHLFNEFQVSLDDQPVTSFGYDKVRALLAYLVVERDHLHKRTSLAGLLWPDQPETAAHDSLRNALVKLRHAIHDAEADPHYLLISKDSLQFNSSSDHWLDVRRFTDLLEACHTHRHRRIEACPTCTDRLIEASTLYRGEFLHGFTLPDSDLFEDWLRDQREQYLQQAIQAFQDLVSTYEWRGEDEKALEYAHKLLKLDPCCEGSYVSIMRLFATLGKRTEACEQYEKCRQALANELAVEPAEETTHLYEQIKYGLFQAFSSRQSVKINNLPTELTSFVGRQQELSEIADLVADPACRLLTLVGPGGVGKTRLAIAAASQQLDVFPNGACFVPLAGVSSIEGILPSILQALDLQSSQQGDSKKQLLEFLRDKEFFIILDNFEHLLEGAAIVTEILQSSPNVMLLVTSRQRLGLQAEWLFEVDGLSYPAGKDTRNLATFESVQLFTKRLHQFKPRQTVFDDDLQAASRICRVVEGMPLGIELAASAVRKKSIEQVASAIESGKQDLATSWKDVPERHRSIRAVFDHSYRMLTEQEQRAFCGLAVFRGGFTAEAADQVAGATEEILEQLVEHSMIRFDPVKDRYDLHELVRQYGHEKLNVQGLQEILHKDHCHYFLKSLQNWQTELECNRQGVALNEMEEDFYNIRIAWDWACNHGNIIDIDPGCIGFFRFCTYRSHFVEGRQDCHLALGVLDKLISPNSNEQLLKVKMLIYSCTFQFYLGEIDFSKRLRVLDMCYQILLDLRNSGIDVLWEIAWVLRELSGATTEPEQSLSLAKQSMDYAQMVDDRSQALSLGRLAALYSYLGKFQLAEEYSLNALGKWRSLGDPRGIAFQLRNLREITSALGREDTALEVARESANIFNSIGDRYAYANGLYEMAEIYKFFHQMDKADETYNECQPYFQTYADQSRLSAFYAYWSQCKLLSGKYDDARIMIQHSMELADQIDDPNNLDFNHYMLGELALAQGQLELASKLLEKASYFCTKYGFTFFLAEVFSALSLAYITSGRIEPGRDLLMQALERGIELNSYPNLSYALVSAAFLLHRSSQIEKSIELYGLVNEHAFCGKTQWLEDVLGKEIKQQSVNFYPEAFEIAYERGRQMDLFETAAKLLEEFKNNPL